MGYMLINRSRGFTLMELMVVMVLIAVLAGLAMPVVMNSIQRSREAVLKENLFIMRKAIDDFYADTGSYPGEIEQLVEKRYLRNIPVDPITERNDTWKVVRDGAGIIDIQSSTDGQPSTE